MGCDIVRKRKGEKRRVEGRERQSLERSLEPLEHLETLEPIAGSKTKTKINRYALRVAVI